MVKLMKDFELVYFVKGYKGKCIITASSDIEAEQLFKISWGRLNKLIVGEITVIREESDRECGNIVYLGEEKISNE